MRCRYPGCITKVVSLNNGEACFAHKYRYARMVDKKIDQFKNEIRILRASPRKKGKAEKIRKLKRKLMRFL